jgi:photosystem II stability/assembly factor-like uncharacterized protein
MPNKLKFIIVAFIIVIAFGFGRHRSSSGQSFTNYIYFPLVSIDRTTWIGPYGGTIVAVAIDPIFPNVIYAGTYGSGVFKSPDRGDHWSEVNSGLGNLQIYSLAIDPVNPSIIYAGTYRSQVYKSTNGGNSWTWAGNGMQNPAIVYSMAIDPVNPSVVYAATRGERICDPDGSNCNYNGIVYKSSNAGLTWLPSLVNVAGPTTEDYAYSLAVNPNRHEQVHATFHQHGLWRSDDSGVTWGYINPGINQYGRSIIISPQLDYSSTYYYGTWDAPSVYKTINSGGLWTSVNNEVIHVYSMAFDPLSANTVYVASFSHGVVKTNNGGQNWQDAGLQSNSLYSIVVNPNATNNLFVGTDGDGLYRSTDYAASWQRSITGINDAMVTTAVHSPTNPNLTYASIYGAGVYTSDGRTNTWQEINNGLDDKFVHDLIMDPSNPSLLYALTDTAGLFQYNLSGSNGWVKVGMGLPLSFVPQSAYPPDHPNATLDMQEAVTVPQEFTEVAQLANVGLLTMVYAPSNSSRAYIGTVFSGAYRSTDGGQSWVSAGLGGQSVYSLAVDVLDPNLVYAATNIANSMKYSTDGGQNWKDANLSAQFYSVTTSPTQPGVVYAGTNTGIYRYQAGSFTSLGLSDQSVTSIACDPNRPGVIFAGTSSGAYYSTNWGSSWTFVDQQLDGQTILSISFNPTVPNLVYFSTKAHGVYLTYIKY